ncbi:MAG: A/G-specific adenine glycosylase [Cyclobacteriaceae bacterium]
MPEHSYLSSPKSFQNTLLKWYGLNKRDLPWRHSSDPYVIWLSEIILQQTRVQQGLPYFAKFLNAYPDVHSFAAADEQDILKHWQGLGYYSRARNMHKCANEVVEYYGGQFPNSYDELLKLKGVGKYTAAAIASFAFQEPVAVLDGNVYRVLARIFGIENDIGESSSYKHFWSKAQELISTKDPGEFNQALMEFGALHCVPKSPDCQQCVFQDVCVAQRNDLQSVLPVKQKKIKKRTRYFNYFIISNGKKLLVNKRKKSDIWEGMYEFHLLESKEAVELSELEKGEAQELKKISSLVTCSDIYKHVLTHQTIFARFNHYEVVDESDFDFIKHAYELKEVSEDDFHTLPISRLTDKYLKKNLKHLT